MDIEWQKKKIVCNFADLDTGETFKLMDQTVDVVYFKTKNNDTRNAVDLTDGRMVILEPNDRVVKLKTKLVVEC